MVGRYSTFLVENKNKIPAFLVENKNFSQNFVIAFEKMFFCLDPDWGKNPGSGSVTLTLAIKSCINKEKIFLKMELLHILVEFFNFFR